MNSYIWKYIYVYTDILSVKQFILQQSNFCMYMNIA